MNNITRVGQMQTGEITLSATPQLATLKNKRTSVGKTAIEIYVTSGTAYIGGPDVTSANGLPIEAGKSKVIPVNANGGEPQIFIAGSGTAILAEYTP